MLQLACLIEETSSTLTGISCGTRVTLRCTLRYGVKPDATTDCKEAQGDCKEAQGREDKRARPSICVSH